MDVCEGWYGIIIITRKKRVLTAHRQEIYCGVGAVDYYREI